MRRPVRTDLLPDLSLSDQQSRDAALLRLITDLFAQEPSHSRDEIRRFEELATHFLRRASPADRAHVSASLAARHDAPHAVILMLARDDIEIARPVLERSPVLDTLDLLAIIAGGSDDHRKAIAGRTVLSPEVDRALRRFTGEAGQPASPSPENPPGAIDLEAARRWGVWQFLSLDRPTRLRLIADIAASPRMQRYAVPSPASARTVLDAALVVGHARRGDFRALVDRIVRSLDLDITSVTACLEDITGEPSVILLKALGLDEAQADQALLTTMRVTGRDLSRFSTLFEFYAGLDRWVAEILVDSWRRRQASPATHQPHFAENGDRVRRPPLAGRRPEGHPFGTRLRRA